VWQSRKERQGRQINASRSQRNGRPPIGSSRLLQQNRRISGRQDIAVIADFNSLIRRIVSLFVEKFSLLILLGKYLKSRCGTGIFGADIVSVTSKTADFPVKFPVRRESARRPARSVLRRQPTSHDQLQMVVAARA
jgi:hypothetical protein